APVRQRRLRVDRRTAARPRLGEQRLVVRFRGPEFVRAHDLLARIVAIAEPPRRRSRRIVADQRHLVRAPDLLETDRRVTAVVPRVEPERLVLVEILRREDVDRQRLDSRRHVAVTRGVDRRIPRRYARPGPVPFALGADDVGRYVRVGRPAADALLREARGVPCGGADAAEHRRQSATSHASIHRPPPRDDYLADNGSAPDASYCTGQPKK